MISEQDRDYLHAKIHETIARMRKHLPTIGPPYSEGYDQALYDAEQELEKLL